jgi:hypothetical protein
MTSARRLLADCNVGEDVIARVCRIIASHHSPGEVDTIEFRILWDADWLVNLNDECDIRNKKKLGAIIEKTFLTKTGIAKAKEIYCEDRER